MSLVALLDSCRRRQDFGPLCEAIPYARFLGMSVRESQGKLLAKLCFQPSNVGNPLLPALHGGVVGGFLETTAALELLWSHDAVELPKVINITLDYLRPAAALDTYASGTITRQGRRIANVTVEAWQENRHRLVATANCHFLLPTTTRADQVSL